MFRPQLDWRLYTWDVTVIVFPPTPNFSISYCRGSSYELENPVYNICDNSIVTNANGVWFKRDNLAPNPAPIKLSTELSEVTFLAYGRRYDDKGYFFEYHIDTGEWKQVSAPILNILVSGSGTTEPAPDKYWAVPREEVTVTATPTAENYFSHFVDSTVEENVTVNPYTFTMDSDRVVTAVFTSDPEPPEEPPIEGFKPKKLIFPVTLILIGYLLAD